MFDKFRPVYEIMWTNMVEQYRPQMTIWRMRFACWITKATNTHSEYVTHRFSTAKWLRKGASVFVIRTLLVGGRDSSVGIATRCGLDGPGIESRCGGEIFRTRPGRPWDPPSLLYNGYRVFPGGKAAEAWR